MHLNFELILASAVFITGLGALLDYIFLAPKRQRVGQSLPLWVEYARSFLPILLIVLFLRSFLFEPFRIPSGSLKPTLVVGDFVLTNKFTYGIRLPVSHTEVIEMNKPKRGDIVVFRFPPDPRVDYIKRIIGLPGDRISYIDKVIYVNGKPAEQTTLGYRTEREEYIPSEFRVLKKQENLNGVVHDIYLQPDDPARNFENLIVPPGQYFAMGDNRDDSRDSREWGFVPDANLVGKAILVWFSWDHSTYSVRWNRIGMRIE
jgi:signal peptidase I